MPARSLFLCQPYIRGRKGGLQPDSAVGVDGAAAARLRAERMLASGRRIVGVEVLRAATGEGDGDGDGPVVLARLGQVPDPGS